MPIIIILFDYFSFINLLDGHGVSINNTSSDEDTQPKPETCKCRAHCCALTSAIVVLVLAIICVISISVLVKRFDNLPSASGNVVVGNSDVVLVSAFDPSNVNEIQMHTSGDTTVNVSFYQDVCVNSKIGPFQHFYNMVSTRQLTIMSYYVYTVDVFYLTKNSQVTCTFSASVPLPCIYTFNFERYQRFISPHYVDDGTAHSIAYSNCGPNTFDTIKLSADNNEYQFLVMRGTSEQVSLNYTVERSILEYDVNKLTPTTCAFSASSRTCSISLDGYHGNQEVCVLAVLNQGGNLTTLDYTTSSASHNFIDVMSRYEMFTFPCVLISISIVLFVVAYKCRK